MVSRAEQLTNVSYSQEKMLEKKARGEKGGKGEVEEKGAKGIGAGKRIKTNEGMRKRGLLSMHMQLRTFFLRYSNTLPYIYIR